MRYLKLIRSGAKSMGLDPEYCKWLETGLRGLPENQQRGKDYYDTLPRARNKSNQSPSTV
eukprot:CAMPEP_0184500126 /NCGR_PEP_ID=MMETSP0113_2-20130426/43699_1 /TAXON_ID=91329 /ORGANISM="Norrisiella sphaerica, Strain BC52" /LENGTH=59 /DNA_ID=CAMNT_0026888349 /DNA_START=86 /DNA_END=265 /DNA_ORIENTATION=+